MWGWWGVGGQRFAYLCMYGMYVCIHVLYTYPASALPRLCIIVQLCTQTPIRICNWQRPWHWLPRRLLWNLMTSLGPMFASSPDRCLRLSLFVCLFVFLFFSPSVCLCDCLQFCLYHVFIYVCSSFSNLITESARAIFLCKIYRGYRGYFSP